MATKFSEIAFKKHRKFVVVACLIWMPHPRSDPFRTPCIPIFLIRYDNEFYSSVGQKAFSVLFFKIYLINY